MPKEQSCFKNRVLHFPPCYLLTSPAKFQKCPWSGLYFPNQIVSAFQILKFGPNRYEIFVSFFDVNGLC